MQYDMESGVSNANGEGDADASLANVDLGDDENGDGKRSKKMDKKSTK